MTTDKTPAHPERYEWLGNANEWKSCTHEEAIKLSNAKYEVREIRPFAHCTCPSGDGSLRHPCPAHPATLATVKHGGCVQLGDWLPPLPDPMRMPPERDGTYRLGYDAEDMQDYARAAVEAALAARQPAGQEPDAWVPATFFDSDSGAMTARRTLPPTTVVDLHGVYEPLYRHPPAQAVDLGQFRSLARSWIVEAGGTVDDTKHACADELLALIDGKAVGK